MSFAGLRGSFWKKKGGGGTEFIMKVDTTKPGITGSSTIRIPIQPTGVDMTIDWGDGNTTYVNIPGNYEHTYSIGGVYTIKFTGSVVKGIRFANSGDRQKLIEISQWGGYKLESNSSFHGCVNLDVTATDVPLIISSLLERTFQGCSSLVFNSSINLWDTIGLTDAGYFFQGCVLFDQPLDGFNVESITDAFLFLSGATLSTANYDALLISWASQSVQSGLGINFGFSKYTNSGAALAARNTLTVTYGWTISDGGPA